jgi:hypothetical protein
MLSAGWTFTNLDQIKALDSVPFTRRKELPDAPGMYFAIVNGDRVAYIGTSKVSLRRRWKEHNRRPSLLALGAVEIAYAVCDDLAVLAEAERAAVRVMRPALNYFHVAGATDHWRQHHQPGRPRKSTPPHQP